MKKIKNKYRQTGFFSLNIFGLVFAFAIFFFGFFGMVENSKADTHTAATCSEANVQSAITAASTGDTVSVPAGTCSWSGEIALGAKQIKLIGAGNASTKVTEGEVSIGTNSRLSGFGFTSTILSDGSADGWRVDHNTFTFASPTTIWVVNGYRETHHPTGLFDNNTVTNGNFYVFGFPDTENGMENATYMWSLGPDYGGANNVVYIEDNNFVGTTPYLDCMDANYGARFVFRYNHVTNTTTEFHGIQGVINRGVARAEIYGNTYSNSGSALWLAIYARSGAPLIFNNTITGNYNGGIAVDNQTSCRYGTYAEDHAACDGNNPRDGNRTGMHGYPCRDQIGRGQDVPEWHVGDAFNQKLSPLYAWNNKKSGSETAVEVTWDVDCSRNLEHLVANRDYYSGASGTQTNKTSPFNGTTGVGYGTLANRPDTCTTNPDETGGGVAYWSTDTETLYRCSATNTWVDYYTPFTYPHPMQGAADTTPPAKPTGLSVS